MANTYLSNNVICMDCGETNSFVVKLYPRYNVKILNGDVVVELDDIELEQEFAALSEKQQHQNYGDWICGRCGGNRITKRYEINPGLNDYYSPLIPTEDVDRALEYINFIKKEEKRYAAKMHKS